jgi:hypothetical protein
MSFAFLLKDQESSLTQLQDGTFVLHIQVQKFLFQ